MAKVPAVTTKRHRIGITAQRDISANVSNVGGGDVNDFSLSRSTVRIAGAAAVKESAANIKINFKKLVEDLLGGKMVLIGHFDGNSLAQFQDQLKSVEKRLAVFLSCPYLDTDQVLGVPITPSNSGKNQMDVLNKVLEEWGIKPSICGLCFDTTSDNTGHKGGAVVLLEEAIGAPVLCLACPHHYYEIEIHVKKVARLYFGDSTYPEEHTYKRLKDNWNVILKKTIKYDQLEFFDWKKWRGKFIAKQAESVKSNLLALMTNNTFPREDSRELLNLVLVWLGVKVKGFQFQYPGAMSHARFQMQSI